MTQLIKYKEIEDKPGYVRQSGSITYREFSEALENYLKSIKMDEKYSVYDWLDYISTSQHGRKINDNIPMFSRIWAYPVPGSNEGYYFHIDVLVRTEKECKTENILLAKTLSEKPDIVLAINTAIQRFLMQCDY